MISLIGDVKSFTAVAVSGGIDSMAALSFLRVANPKIKAFYFHHNTEHGEDAYQFLKKCNLPLEVGFLKTEKTEDLSWEEFWRIERYKFLHSFSDEKIVTAHHLNDVAETYLWSCMHGPARYIHYNQPGPNGLTNIFRPFLKTPKADLASYCQRHLIPFINDPSNLDVHYSRNRIRSNILPEVLKVNPGFLTNVRSLLIANLASQGFFQREV